MQTYEYVDTQPIESWLSSDKTAHISGLDLKPLAHPLLPKNPQCIMKGQASVFFLRQYPQGNIWLLKKFALSRRPSDEYLQAVTECLPGLAEFFTCTQRRLLTAGHLDLRKSGYKNGKLGSWIEGTILMPKVPGTPWSSIADELREGTIEMSMLQRLQTSLSLAECIGHLEAMGVSHRDLSGGNVFVSHGRVYVIDWDCFFSPQLPFQPNTSAGTMGYIAPFMKISSGNWDAFRSWCTYADRFALSIIITEFMLISTDTPIPREDGSFFSQTQLDEPNDPFVGGQTQKLRRLSRKCASLLEASLRACSFEECPLPGQWRDALRYTLRREKSQQQGNLGQTAFRRRVMHVCANCGDVCSVDKARSIELKNREKPVLCHSCLSTHLENSSAARLQRDLRRPKIVCEHCGVVFRIWRDKLNGLRSKGKAILCHSCFQKQLLRWGMEQAEQKRHCKQTNQPVYAEMNYEGKNP